jgi:hypothetical protein
MCLRRKTRYLLYCNDMRSAFFTMCSIEPNESCESFPVSVLHQKTPGQIPHFSIFVHNLKLSTECRNRGLLRGITHTDSFFFSDLGNVQRIFPSHQFHAPAVSIHSLLYAKRHFIGEIAFQSLCVVGSCCNIVGCTRLEICERTGCLISHIETAVVIPA